MTMMMMSSPSTVTSTADLVTLPGGGTRPRSRSLVIGAASGPSPMSYDEPAQQQDPAHLFGGLALGGADATLSSDRYKTELCRSYAETGGKCRYGDRCQFAHGPIELRSVDRHPRYKTELCRTFHSRGFCAYGPRCHFIHNVDEMRISPNALLEQMILQHQMADLILLNQLAAGTSASPPPPTTACAPSITMAAHQRRLSLDNYVGLPKPLGHTAWDNRLMTDLFSHTIGSVAVESSTATSLERGVPAASWPAHQTTINRLLSSSSPSSQASTASDDELFRTRSMSLGSAASRSVESCSGSSSPGPPSPTNAVDHQSTGGPWASFMRLATTVFDDSHQWFGSSWSVPDSPTSLVGSGVAESSFYSSLRQANPPCGHVISFDEQSSRHDERRHETATAKVSPKCVVAGGCSSQRRAVSWPTR